MLFRDDKQGGSLVRLPGFPVAPMVFLHVGLVAGVSQRRGRCYGWAGSLLIGHNDEWLVRRRYVSEASMAELTSAAQLQPERSCRSHWPYRRHWW
jgi:hypothetical protein